MTTIIRTPVLRLGLLFLLSIAVVSCGRESDDGAMQALGTAVSVRVAQAETRDVQQDFNSIGRIVSKNTPVLAAEINARVVDVLVDAGERAQRNQVLVRLDTTASGLARQEAQAAIKGLQVSIANEERRVKRYRDLKTKEVMPQERLDDAEAKLAADRAAMTAAQARLAIAEDPLAKAELKSPVNGVVERRHVSIGDYVKVGSPMVTVTDTNDLRAELPFPETIAHLLQPGQVLFLESPIAPGQVIKAQIDQIRPQVGLMNRALVVIADIENPGNWRPEATVEATVVVESRPDAVVVPVMSVVQRPAGKVVYALEQGEPMRVRQRVVETGQRHDGWVEVVSGLESGTVVVSEGAHYLTDGAEVAVRERAQ